MPQAGLEITFSIMSAFLTRNTLVHDVGYIEFGSTSSMEMLVIADEVISMVRYLAGGLPVNATTLALEATRRVRPGGGYIADKHTLHNFRTAQWTPEIIDRSYFDDWRAAGSKDMYTPGERTRPGDPVLHGGPPTAGRGGGRHSANPERTGSAA